MSDAAKVLRLFVAVELPADVRACLADVQASLKRNDLARLRWVKPDNIHITLKFLGETPANRRPDIERALGEAVKGVLAFDITLGKLGKFGGRQNPRVLWVDAAGDLAALTSLQKRIEAKLAPLGFPPENREFSVHLTLARIPEDMQRGVAQSIEDVIASTSVPNLPIAVREVSLMLSELRREGAIYTRLASFPLA